MPSEKTPFYDPIPPTYDEALATGSARDYNWEAPSPSIEDRDAREAESHSLLRRPETSAGPSRGRRGYEAPTAESDEESSLFGSDGDGDEDEDEEAAHVRREMQEMEIEEPSRSRGSVWGKRIPFSLSLPRFKWSWRPRLPRLRIQLPSRPATAEASNNDDAEESQTTTETRRWQWPKVESMTMVIISARIIALLVVLGFFYFLFASGFFGGFGSRFNGGVRFDPEDVKRYIQSNVEPLRMRASVQHYSSYAHIAGTEGDYATAMDVESMFTRAGLDSVDLEEFYVYVNYPTKDGRTVQIMDSGGEMPVWTAKLDEDEHGGETAGHQTYAFHGHSKSGDVKGPLIYANYGSKEDFDRLKDKGIDTKGAMALVRHYGSQTDQGLKVKAAEMAGFAGCLIYSDPSDNGFLKGDVAPAGRFMPEDGVQRGAVSLRSFMVGDPLTPGWESTPKMPRMAVNETAGLVKIPSLPLAWRDARVLLQHLKGHGEQVANDWKGGDPAVAEWWTGNLSSPVVRLKNEQDEIIRKPIWNVYGKIRGMEQAAKSIVLGNHRDAWAFGATRPHTGTAVMIEVARIFGSLVERGWRPLRTIEFMSWDAEEYNLIGSTEYVEKNLDLLRENAYAYINLDDAITGTDFRAAGSPVLERALLRALERVTNPSTNDTLKQEWETQKSKLAGLGAGSDYAAFQDIAGTSSLDLQFAGDSFPQHSSYDNFNLVEQVIDPGFVYHGLMGQVIGLLLHDLSDRAIMPFDMVAYARRLKTWLHDLESWVDKQTGAQEHIANIPFKELNDAVDIIKSNAEEFERWELEWDHSVLSSGGYEANGLGEQRVAYNDKMAAFETALLDVELGGGVSDCIDFSLPMPQRFTDSCALTRTTDTKPYAIQTCHYRARKVVWP